MKPLYGLLFGLLVLVAGLVIQRVMLGKDEHGE